MKSPKIIKLCNDLLYKMIVLDANKIKIMIEKYFINLRLNFKRNRTCSIILTIFHVYFSFITIANFQKQMEVWLLFIFRVSFDSKS